MSLELSDSSASYLEVEPFSPFLYTTEICDTGVLDIEILIEPGTVNIFGASFAFAEALQDQSSNPLLTESRS